MQPPCTRNRLTSIKTQEKRRNKTKKENCRAQGVRYARCGRGVTGHLWRARGIKARYEVWFGMVWYHFGVQVWYMVCKIWGRGEHRSQMLNNDKPLALVAMPTHIHTVTTADHIFEYLQMFKIQIFGYSNIIYWQGPGANAKQWQDACIGCNTHPHLYM